MNIFFLVVISIIITIEILILIFKIRNKGKKNKLLKKSLYQMIETRVLEQSLKYRITSGQATLQEYSMPFLNVEFLNTKPQITYLYSLDEWITIGRAKENKICIHDGTFSRMHCKIGMIGNVLVLQDQGSANGEEIKRGLLHRVVVSGGGQEILQSGDCIQIGDYRMKIRMIYGSDAIG